jgi:hypothetical protein
MSRSVTIPCCGCGGGFGRARGTRRGRAASPAGGAVPAAGAGAPAGRRTGTRNHGQKGSRPMKPSSLVWVSALPGTSTRAPNWPEERITSSICSIPPRS